MKISRTISVPEELAGRRLDQAAALLWPDFSRSRIQTWIREGFLTVNGALRAGKATVSAADELRLDAELAEEVAPISEPIPLTVIHRDSALFIIDKPAGLVVHPGAGNTRGTLQNALLHLDPELVSVPRAGIVHRLDKDTSGLLIVARSLTAHHRLVERLQERAIKRTYWAVCQGELTGGGTIDAPVGRHPSNRLKMAVRDGGKPALTRYRLLDRFRGHSLVEAQLETGRTHQIRVHFAHRGFPLVGDPVYGGRPKFPKSPSPALLERLGAFKRQALHAQSLAFEHPTEGVDVRFSADPPSDFAKLLQVLVEDRDGA